MYVRSVSNLLAKTARFPREPALAATDLSARSATASATERMERRAAELVLEAGAAKAAAAEARWALTGARAEATTRVAEAETAKDIVVLLRVARGGSGRRRQSSRLRSGREKCKPDPKTAGNRGIVKAFVIFCTCKQSDLHSKKMESPRQTRRI